MSNFITRITENKKEKKYIEDQFMELHEKNTDKSSVSLLIKDADNKSVNVTSLDDYQKVIPLPQSINTIWNNGENEGSFNPYVDLYYGMIKNIDQYTDGLIKRIGDGSNDEERVMRMYADVVPFVMNNLFGRIRFLLRQVLLAFLDNVNTTALKILPTEVVDNKPDVFYNNIESLVNIALDSMINILPKPTDTVEEMNRVSAITNDPVATEFISGTIISIYDAIDEHFATLINRALPIDSFNYHTLMMEAIYPFTVTLKHHLTMTYYQVMNELSVYYIPTMNCYRSLVDTALEDNKEEE